MDYSRGYAAAYRLVRVDPDLWGDGAEIRRVTGVSLTTAIDSDAPSVDGGTVDLDSAYPGDGYVRVWMDAEQSGLAERVPLGTYWMVESDGAPQDGGSECELRSVLWPASEAKVPVGTRCRRGQDGAARAAELLRERCACPGALTGTDPVEKDVVSEDGETALEFAWALLSSCQITTDGWGRVTVGPRDATRVVVPSSHVIGAISTSRNSDGARQLDYGRELLGLRAGGVAVVDGREYRVTQQSAECGCGVVVSETAVEL